jgi:hypothetical protein
MMTLTNFQGDTLQLWIEGYQYLDLDGYHWDLNWLSVYVRWQRGSEIWQACDPCLSTEEVLELADWFQALPTCQMTSTDITFMEPGLKFEWLVDQCLLRIYLREELDPRRSDNLPSLLQPVITKHSVTDDPEDFYLEFPLSPVNIQTQLKALHTMAAQFPVRHERNLNEE